MHGRSWGSSSPYLIPLALIPVLFLNVLVVVNPLIIEGMIIRAPPPVWTSLDWWFVRSVFGSFSDFPYNLFIPILLGIYVISFLIGFLIAILLLRRVFGQLLKNHEVTFSERRLTLRFLDFIAVLFPLWLAFDRILAYVTQYPWPLAALSYSCMFQYTITGFWTGSFISKSLFPLRVYLVCRREGLQLKVVKDLDSDLIESSLTKWVLTPTNRSR